MAVKQALTEAKARKVSTQTAQGSTESSNCPRNDHLLNSFGADRCDSIDAILTENYEPNLCSSRYSESPNSEEYSNEPLAFSNEAVSDTLPPIIPEEVSDDVPEFRTSKLDPPSTRLPSFMEEFGADCSGGLTPVNSYPLLPYPPLEMEVSPIQQDTMGSPAPYLPNSDPHSTPGNLHSMDPIHSPIGHNYFTNSDPSTTPTIPNVDYCSVNSHSDPNSTPTLSNVDYIPVNSHSDPSSTPTLPCIDYCPVDTHNEPGSTQSLSNVDYIPVNSLSDPSGTPTIQSADFCSVNSPIPNYIPSGSSDIPQQVACNAVHSPIATYLSTSEPHNPSPALSGVECNSITSPVATYLPRSEPHNPSSLISSSTKESISSPMLHNVSHIGFSSLLIKEEQPEGMEAEDQGFSINSMFPEMVGEANVVENATSCDVIRESQQSIDAPS